MPRTHTYPYARPAYTADIVLLRNSPEKKKEVLLIRRKKDPFKNQWALPGGFCEPEETSGQAAIRELQEETGIQTKKIQLIGVFDKPGRDPRGWTVSAAFLGHATTNARPKPSDDAAEARWIPLKEIRNLPLAFDHREILEKALRMDTGFRR